MAKSVGSANKVSFGKKWIQTAKMLKNANIIK